MSKNANTRIAEIKATCVANQCNPGALDALVNRGGLAFAQQCSNAVSMGKHGPRMSQMDLQKRELIRAVIFMGLIKRRMKTVEITHQKTKLNMKALPELQRILRSEFAVNRDNSKQAQWGPHAFNNPANHIDTNYRYLIHGLQSNSVKIYRDANTITQRFDDWVGRYRGTQGAGYDAGGGGVDASIRIKMYQEYLRDPSLLRTDVVSCSVVGNVANGTYTDFGLILKAPAANIMLTSNRDLEFKNRGVDQRAELEKYAQNTPMLTPTEVLTGMAGRGANKSPLEKNRVYSEVVVLGTSPEGGQVQVTGLWVRVNEDGDAYSHNTGSYRPTVDEEIKAHMLRCANTYNLPVVELYSPGGGRET